MKFPNTVCVPDDDKRTDEQILRNYPYATKVVRPKQLKNESTFKFIYIDEMGPHERG